MIEVLVALLGEAEQLIVERDGQHRSFVEEVHRITSSYYKLGKGTGPPATTIISFLLQSIPIFVDSISSDVKLLRNDNGTAIQRLHRAGPFLLRLLFALDETGEDFRHKAPDLLFNKGILILI